MGFSSKHPIIFILMFISAYRDQIIIAQAQESTPYYLAWKFCFGTNYTANSTYRTNLNLFFSSLSTKFTNNTVPLHGYHNIKIGESPNTVYGSLHCREDMAPAICSKCVQIATERVIMQNSGCPNRKTAILFYNGCILRYSDENYFSVLRQQPSINLTYTDNSVVDQVQYIDIITGLLDDLVIEAVTNTSISPSLYATRSANYTMSDQVYVMVQCTPDLTPSVCYKCLRSAVGRLSGCCSGAQGARVLFPSCTFRFEKAPFFGNYVYNIIRASPPTL
ncbi:hypothetical protein MKW94_013614 [Papaver nudicaule]|uniref:Gnk2-homologous domain-containing protein n=1 Tax=Papaver nudicaule TaxID=74823 RepID=A0AA41RTZ8_PAPNU|nr:hypothetical protein [Papaver nudicaule]